MHLGRDKILDNKILEIRDEGMMPNHGSVTVLCRFQSRRCEVDTEVKSQPMEP
jgi:hypothetical protein